MSGLSNLAHGTWKEAHALVGSTIGTLRGVDEVNAADMRRKLEVIGFDCPLHYDEARAREHGYETIVSPVSMARVWAMPPYWAPGQPRITDELMTTPIVAAGVPGVGDALIATGASIRYGAPAYPGDRITAATVLKSVTEKTTRLGPGAFLVVATTFANQREEVIAVETVTLLRYQQQPPAGDSDGARRADARAAEPEREALPPYPVTLTLQRLVMEAAANRDFAPIHFDQEHARSSGAPTAYANTTFVETVLEALIRSWAGLAARIEMIEFTMIAFNCVGDEIEAHGAVTGRENGPDGGESAELELWVEGPRGRTVTGRATVTLPGSRATS